MSDGRRILFVSHTAPAPPVSGERQRAFNLLRELGERDWEVSLFCIEHGQLAPDALEQLHELAPGGLLVQPQPHPAWRVARSRLDVLRGRAFQRSFFLNRSSRRAFHSWIAGQEYDVIMVALIYMLAYLPPELASRTVLDSQNAEFHRLQSMASAKSGRGRALAARWQLRAVEQFEREASAGVARTTAVSQTEVDYFERFAPGRVDLVPNGVDTTRLIFEERSSSQPQVLFLGSLDYGANVDALKFLIEDVLPRVRHSSVRLIVAGSNPRPEVRRIATRSPHAVELVGRVPDAAPYFSGSRMLLVPLRFGGGTRLKILESFARGCPVVSTTIGCEGIGVEDERELLVADGAPALAEAIDRLLENPQLGERLAHGGRQLAEASYDWSTITDRLEETLESVKEARARARAG
ncbi:MAG: glycosyltransferase family 4 protein [Gaiellaceae bacterium]